MNNIERASICDVLGHTRNSLMNSSFFDSSYSVDFWRDFFKDRDDIEVLKTNVCDALINDKKFESHLYRYLQFLTLHPTYVNNLDFKVGKYLISDLYGDNFEINYSSSSYFSDSNNKFDSNFYLKNKDIFMDSTGNIQYDCSVSQDFKLSRCDNRGPYGNCIYDTTDNMISCNRIISNFNGEISDDVEFVVPSKYVNSNIEFVVPSFSSYKINGDNFTKYRYHHDAFLDEKVCSMSNFIHLDGFKRVDYNYDLSTKKNYNYVISNRNVDREFNDNICYSDLELSFDKKIINDMLRIKYVCDFCRSTYMKNVNNIFRGK